ncbi:MAG: PorV/PorQ family protein [Elusimicrobia bacterium]|nr:PorV/PorQ family protein [Elusimicrobiota bacterium]
MKRKSTLLLLLAIVFPVLSFAGGADAQSGLFLTDEPSARVSALGGVSLLAANDPGAMYINPALLGNMTGNVRLAASAWKDVAAVGTYSFGYAALKLGGLGALGFGYLGYASGSDKVYDTNGTQTGNVKFESDSALSAGLGLHAADWLFIGGQVKSVTSKLAEKYTADALTFDAGIMFKISDRFTLGAGVQNITGELKYKTVGDPLLRVIRAGAGYRLDLGKNNAIIGVEAQKPADADVNLGAGVEYNVAGLSLRGGMKRAGGAEKETSFTAGAGFNFGGVGLDYAFQPAGNLGEVMHKVTLNVGFGVKE